MAPKREPLVTQMFFAGDAQNARDVVLMAIRDARQRDSVMVTLQPGERLGPSALMGTFQRFKGLAAAAAGVRRADHAAFHRQTPVFAGRMTFRLTPYRPVGI